MKITDDPLEELTIAADGLSFQALADAMPIMVWTARPDGKLDFVNRYIMNYFDRSREAMIGDGWQAVLHPDDIPRVLEDWTRSLQTGEPHLTEFRVWRGGDQQYRWLDSRAQAMRDEEGTIVRWLGTCVDVHDVRYTRAALDAVEARYRLYAESTREGIWYWDIRANRLEWSARVHELVGLSREQLGGTLESFLDLTHPDDREQVSDAISAHIARGERCRQEFRMRGGSGAYLHVLVHGVAERDAEGTAFRMAGGLVDMTEQKRAEAELNERLATIERQAEAIRELSTPIIEVWEGVLTVPVLGSIDGERAQRLMDVLLQTAVERRCRVAILDLTGVREMDEPTLGNIGRMLSALALLGAKGIIVGITPEVARAMVSLQLSLSGVMMLRNLRQALLFCMGAGAAA